MLGRADKAGEEQGGGHAAYTRADEHGRIPPFRNDDTTYRGPDRQGDGHDDLEKSRIARPLSFGGKVKQEVE